MNKIYYYIHSLIFCLRYLPVKQAIKIPILVWHDVKVKSLRRGDIILTGKIERATILLGFECTKGRDTYPLYIYIGTGSHLYLSNNVSIARGARIVIKDNGCIFFGEHFACNGNCAFYSNRDITIKEECMCGWNVELNTTDGHTFVCDGVGNPSSGDITIEKHVWLGSDTIVSKNVTIADNCVVARRSIVTKPQMEPNALIAGTPAKVIRHNVSWKG